MKRFQVLFLVLTSCALALPAFAQNQVDIFGYYYIVKPPKIFADISEIHLAGEYGASQKPPIHGLIRLRRKNSKDFRLFEPVLKGKNISFKTRSVSGIRYEFVGEFVRLDDFPARQPNNEILLKGRLSKYQGKKRVGEANLKFSYYAGH